MKKPNLSSKATGISFSAIDKIKSRMASFSPQQMVLAEFILKNPENLIFLSITDLAKRAKVSQATIVRFANLLGYEGYAAMVSETRQSIQFEMSAAGRFRLGQQSRIESVKKSDKSVFSRVIGQEIENLINLDRNIREDDFYLCSDRMLAADRICIIGCLASTILAAHFGHMLSKILPQIDVINNHSITTSAILRRLSKRSLVFLIAFPRYPRETLELGRLSSLQEPFIVAITDSHLSPILKLANISFYIPIGIPSFIDAYAAPIAFINSLVTYVSEKDINRTQTSLDHYDMYTSEFDLLLRQNSIDFNREKNNTKTLNSTKGKTTKVIQKIRYRRKS